MNGTRKRSQEEATRTEKRARYVTHPISDCFLPSVTYLRVNHCRTEAGEGATPSPLPSSSHDEAMKSSEASKASLDIDARVGAGAPPHVQGAVSALSNIEEKYVPPHYLSFTHASLHCIDRMTPRVPESLGPLLVRVRALPSSALRVLAALLARHPWSRQWSCVTAKHASSYSAYSRQSKQET